MTSPVVLWFRQDLRLRDNPSLSKAVTSGAPLIPVYIYSPEAAGEWVPGGASRWWLHQSLQALQDDLARVGSRLIIRRGPPETVLRELAQETGATHVHWSRRYEPWALAESHRVQESLVQAGLQSVQSAGNLLFEPWTVHNKSGRPFQVFSPFWKHCQTFLSESVPQARPTEWASPLRWPAGEDLEALGLMPKIPWYQGMAETWTPGETGAWETLNRFLEETLAGYDAGRDLPAALGVSCMSPYLALGEISPRQIVDAVRQRMQGMPVGSTAMNSALGYLRQLGWREFSYHLLYHFPQSTHSPLKKNFEAFPWREDPDALKRWQRGQTGYPIVDAGMRQLWHTGWMHNRVRMLVASFLTKDLLIPWQQGAAWFWDTLVDADLANNTMGWQWTAGSGADASPYFRVFNPVLQGKKFDPHGTYVRRWVPELRQLPDAWIHQPWEATPLVLAQAGITLGETYPKPMVDHFEAKDRALAALKSLRSVDV